MMPRKIAATLLLVLATVFLAAPGWWDVNGTRIWKANPTPSDPFAEYASYAALPSSGMQDGDTAYTSDTRTRWEYVGTRGSCPVNMWLPHADVQDSQGCVLTTTGSHPIFIDTGAGDTEAALAARGWTISEAGGAVTDEAAGLQLTSTGGDSSIVEITAAGTIPAHVLLVVEMAVTACGSGNNSCGSVDIRGSTKQHTLSPSQGGTLDRYGMTSSATATISAPNLDVATYARFLVRGGLGKDAEGWSTTATSFPLIRIHSASASEAAPASTHSVRVRTGTSSGNTVIIKRLFLLETVP